MIERMSVPPRGLSWMPDQNPDPGNSQAPESLGPGRFKKRFLTLWGRDVESWRGRFSEAPCLRSLRIQGSALTALPEDISQLRYLQTLVILNVNLFEFPMWICEMKQLRELTVRGTNISHFPNELSNLVQLRKLEAGNNLLRHFNVDLRRCRKFGWLHIPDNDLDDFPSKLPPKTRVGLAGTPYRRYSGWRFKDLPSE